MTTQLHPHRRQNFHHERGHYLNISGVIRGNHAVLDPDRVDLSLCAFVFVDLVPHPDEQEFRRQVTARSEVQEVQQVAGSHCYLLKVRVAGPQALQRLLADHIKTQADVLRTETVIVLETVKETPTMALLPRCSSGPLQVPGDSRAGS